MIYFIEYAEPHCSTELVQQTFDDRFLNTVYKIREETDLNDEFPFKRFWVYLDRGRACQIERDFLDEIGKNGFALVAYEHGKKQYCWNVTLYGR